MLRPTLKELLTALQGTVQQMLLPELTSPYVQGQAMYLIGMLMHAADSIERERLYNEGEVRDLYLTIRALKRLEQSHLKRGSGDLKKSLSRGVKAAAALERREMEATLSAFVTALALGKLDAALSKVVKGWLRRHLARQSEFLGNNVPS
ncbi:MAG TPA: hypothetical protein VKB29_03195 [Candidatus Binataceae bacterium]|nr:hypothetical protein [Candidatus Binataceae bacterium]